LIKEEESDFIVLLADPEPIAEVIRLGLTDDTFKVSGIYKCNTLVERERLNQQMAQPQVVDMCKRVYANRRVKERITSP